jgi:hypothetical protein
VPRSGWTLNGENLIPGATIIADPAKRCHNGSAFDAGPLAAITAGERMGFLGGIDQANSPLVTAAFERRVQPGFQDGDRFVLADHPLAD